MAYGNNSYRYILYTCNIFTDSTGLDIILQGIDDNDNDM